MRNIVALSIIILMVGCNPCKRLYRLCPVEVYDSISYIETIKLDTLTIVLPGDTTYIEVPFATLSDIGLFQDNADQQIELKVEDGILKLKTICKEDSLQVVITELTKELSNQQVEIRKVPEPYPEKFTPKWIRVLAIIGGTFILLVILYILYKVFKPKLPFMK